MIRPLLLAALATLMLSACGKEAPPPAPTGAATSAAAPAAASAKLDDAKAQELMSKAGCAACHAIDRKGVGPAYTDVAAKRRNQPGAAAALMKKVREGGAGDYGSIPMPPNPASRISDDDLKALIDWVLTK